MDFTGPSVLRLWDRARCLPGGACLFSWVVGKLVPYTGTVAPRIRELEEGRAVVTIEDRRRVRNHLRSVHAVALANLAEFTGSLAMVTRVPADRRWIVTGLDIEYVKKARGRITAACDVRSMKLPREGQARATVRLHDADGDEVVVATVRLKVGPKRQRAPAPEESTGGPRKRAKKSAGKKATRKKAPKKRTSKSGGRKAGGRKAA